jgi:hypothetical protein
VPGRERVERATEAAEESITKSEKLEMFKFLSSIFFFTYDKIINSIQN